MVGVSGLEPETSPLSGVYSNQLSYTPVNKKTSMIFDNQIKISQRHFKLSLIVWAIRDILLKGGDPTAGSPTVTLLRLHPSRWFHRGG
jgi:hypothetical protein